jgi:hypothetical protein
MKRFLNKIYWLSIFIIISCNNDKEIFELLQSNDKDDMILGSYKAGETGNKRFIPLLLNNADDSRRSTNLRFIGISVYQSKMIALRKILKKDPPNEITRRVDSMVIKFYITQSKDK